MRKPARIKHRFDKPVVGNHRPQRRIARTDPLGHHHDIGPHPPVIAAQKGAGPPGPGHHLVHDQQHAIVVADRPHALQIPLGRDQRPGRCAPDRFDDEPQHAVGPLGLDPRRKHVGVMPPRLGVGGVEPVQIGPWRGDLGHDAHQRLERLGQRRIAGGGQRAQRAAMIGRRARDDLPPAAFTDGKRILTRQFDRAFHRLGPAGDKKDAVQTPGHLFGQPRRHFFRCLGFEMQPVAKGRLLHLPLHGRQHVFVGVADIADHGTGRAVEIPPPVLVPHIDAARLIQHRFAPAPLIEQVAHLSPPASQRNPPGGTPP